MKLKFFFFAIAATCFIPNVAAQTDDDPSIFNGIGQEEVWPLVYHILAVNKLSIADFNYGENKLVSDYFYFVDLMYRYRTKFIFEYDDYTLKISYSIVEQRDKEGKWAANSFMTSKKKRLNKEKGKLIEYIKEGVQNKEHMTEIQSQFYTCLEVLRKFFDHATELAGNRWFENYLKNKQINWNLTFTDLKKNNDGQYSYTETYTYSPTKNSMNTLSDVFSAFFVNKYTNSDKNVFATKNSVLNVTGYCQQLKFVANIFYILITDEATADLTNVSIGQSDMENTQKNTDTPSIINKADELIKLKSLLDNNIITQEEYEIEKTKILNN